MAVRESLARKAARPDQPPTRPRGSCRRQNRDCSAQRAAIAAIIGALDRPRLVTQRLATTLRAPFDRVMLVGGMTFAARPQGNDPPLYLFLRATVQELKDDTKRAEAVEPVEPRKADPEEVENEAAR